jgi:hypothetical protein
MRTVEAIIQPSGEVRMIEPVQVRFPRRALVTILDEEPQAHEAAVLSEAAAPPVKFQEVTLPITPLR